MFQKTTITTFLIEVPYGTVSFWYYTTLDGARLGQVHLTEQFAWMPCRACRAAVGSLVGAGSGAARRTAHLSGFETDQRRTL